MADSPRKRAWRNTGTPKPASPPVEAAWRNPQTPLPQGPSWWKSKRVQLGFILTAVLGVATGIIVFVKMWHWPKPFTLVVITADYRNNLFVPPNVAGRNGAIRLTEEPDWNPQTTPLARQFEDVDRAVYQKKPGKIVLFVTAHGVARLENRDLVPYLVPQDADLRNDAPLYRLDRLLEALRQLDENAPKLLLLDVSSVDVHWPLGQLHNDFALALKSLEPRINGIKNLVVISSSDEDQRSWISPEWGQTYFAHFVIEGLKGAADQPSEEGNGNGRVDALELFNYVKSNVKRWVWHNRERPQTPVKFGDDQRAKNMELTPCPNYQANNTVSETAAARDDKDYKDLQDAWTECGKLRRAMPHPAAYPPHLWRRYLDVLLRAEQLLCSGDADAAKKMLRKLEEEDLQRRLIQSRSLELKSAQLTLAMSAALGLQPAPQERRELAKIAELWKWDAANKEDEDKAVAAFEKYAGANPQRRQMYRAALTDTVFRDIAEGSEQGLYRGRRLLGSVDPLPPECRSAEAHYLMMLADNPTLWRSQDEANWPLLQQSLRLRRTAEQAAVGLNENKDTANLPAYSEQVWPWIKHWIDEADAPRRRGQDLLFASSAEDQSKAKTEFDSARVGYEKAQAVAVKIRRALDVRDRLYAELPYYTHWVAEQGFEHEEDIVKLWNELHQLRRLLEKPVSGEEGTALAAQLDERQRHLAEDFKKIQRWLEESDANKERNSAQYRWHEIEAALTVPFLEPETRLKLIRNSRDISRDLFEHSPKQGNPEIPNTEAGRKSAQNATLRQGRLALAMLGKDDWPEHESIKNALQNNLDEGAWYRTLVLCGQGIGQFLNRLPEAADQKCEEAAQKDVDTAAALLQSAARCARTIEGAAVLTRMKQDPLEEQRRLLWHNLLCRQANRTFLDWWAELEQTPQTRPYFQRAGAIFLADAEQLLMGKSANAKNAGQNPRLKQVNAERQRLGKFPEVVVKSAMSSEGDYQPGPARLNLTDEPAGLERYFRLYGPDAQDVPGTPVMWVEVQPKGQSGLQVISEEEERKKAQFGPPTAYPKKIAALRRTERGSASPRHVVHGFFRGHHPSLTTEVRMYREPSQTLSLPLRHGGGSVAVQTKRNLYDLFGADRTALNIVLDCSGSMNLPKSGPTRFDKAVKALKSVLHDLPKGVMVSLREFGAEESDELRDIGGMKLVWEPHPWDPDKIRRQMGKVESLTPAYTTPLLRSIRMASKDFPDVPLESRTIVVITDGGDSNFYVKDMDEDLKKKSGARTIADYMKYLKREFDRDGIQLIVIGFDVKDGQMPSAEEEKSSKEFREVMQKIWGTYHDADYEKDNLAAILRRSLLRLYFRVDPEHGAPSSELGVPGGPITQSDFEEVPHYVPREPGHWEVRVPSTRKLHQLIGIGPGDAMLLDLVRDPESGDAAFRRCLYAKSHLAKLHRSGLVCNAEPVDNWHLAVWQNHQSREAFTLHMLATLEKEEGIAQPRSLLQQVWPAWCWFEVPAADAKAAAPPLYINRVSNYPAPAWGLEVPIWQPWGAPVVLKTWWRTKLPDSPHGTLVKGPDFQSPFEPKLTNFKWRADVPPGEVLLESIQIERHRMPVVEGGGDKEVDCLTVRLSYPAATGPFFVDWPGWLGGRQHRFYTEAGKYTAIFWSEGKDMKEIAEKELKMLHLYSVAQLKEGALHVKELKLGKPNEGWDRPTPAPAVRHNRR